ncbi:MAG: tRNA lysidine(34) synthetase TilS [Clostridia bacterium]|nr:tRNA lysidine(34) synthetase TilS [Clostridia bacterium]
MKRQNWTESQLLCKKVENTILKYQLIEKGDKLVVAVSGGPDSICLLDYLRQCSQFNLSFHIIVAHLNHGLRKEADEEEEYVKNYCEKNEIEFYAKRIDVEKLAHTNKIGTEEAGRMARYEFLNEVLVQTDATKIAIAHNKNDNIETIFLNLLRGSGVEGLKGIEPKRGNIIRPLIECERFEIEKYCEENQLQPRIDKTNLENIYQRNKIRNIVIPYIQKEFNPNIIKTMERLCDIVTKEDEYMEHQAQDSYQKLLIDEKESEITIHLKEFNLLETVIKARLIRYIIKRLFGSSKSIEKIHIEDIIKLCSNNVGNKYLTPNKNIKVLVKEKKIHFIMIA